MFNASASGLPLDVLDFNTTVEAFPWYYVSRSELLPGIISDRSLSLVAPIVAYWSFSLFFHALDCSQWKWLDQYRLHEPSEVTSRNKATMGQVLRAVVLQQAIQTTLGWWWLEPDAEDFPINHSRAMIGMYPTVSRVLSLALGDQNASSILVKHGAQIVSSVYWWLIPVAQLLFALFIIDTWQYFLHRLFHTNKFLYRQFHSVHHRLYVPYAFGALYNHWFEGLLLDTLGAVVAQSLSFMTLRQALLLFTFSTLKTVDDHCGYSLPFDPLQVMFPNNASYHDIHHRTWGIKYNFSQPFYVHWDTLLQTRYRGGAPSKKEKVA